jgi:tRNA-dihydrouridine synthase B
MARAAQMVVEAGADIVDINMGCPVKKVTKTGSGAALMKNAAEVAGIVSAVRLACPVPLTVKVRAGWSPSEPSVCEIARIIEDCGADAITVHPRFATQGYALPADWEWIGRVKERLTIPVIGNGDVFKPSQALKLKRKTDCDGVMLGRGAVNNPWLFTQVKQLERGLPMMEPTLSDRRGLILEHFQGLCETMGEHRAALVMRGLLLRYTKGLPHSSDFRGSISRINDLESLTASMDTYFTLLQDRSP